MGASLSLLQARRIALAAQGLDKERPTGPVSSRAVGRTFARLQLVQIDSVNVVTRSHFLPFFSRLGNYDRGTLTRMAETPPRQMVEYWAHEASFIRPQYFPDLVLWQRRKWVGAAGMDTGVRSTLEARIVALLQAGPPLTAAELTAAIGHQEERRRDNWGWNWNSVKRVLEHLFQEGVVSTASRTEQFERRYALTSSVLPGCNAGVAEREGPGDPAAAMVRLIDAAAQAHGIGTIRCFADYFRTPHQAADEAVRFLVEQGRLESVVVDGWNRKTFRHVEARLPRRAEGQALLSPFDSLVFERRRLEDLFGFHYRIEIYKPREKRQFGYYVLPFLLRDSIVARVDLKADRANRRLLVRAAYAEPAAPADTATELAGELRLLVEWLGLDEVVVEPAGDLAAALAVALGTLPDRMLSGNSVGGP